MAKALWNRFGNFCFAEKKDQNKKTTVENFMLLTICYFFV